MVEASNLEIVDSPYQSVIKNQLLISLIAQKVSDKMIDDTSKSC